MKLIYKKSDNNVVAVNMTIFIVNHGSLLMRFGDRDTGAWRYDGKSMKNFTHEDGLTTFHISQIYQTKKGELWFAMADGAECGFNGKSFDRIF